MSEKDKSSITMHDVDPGALQLLVDFAYTGEILISEDNVQVSTQTFYGFANLTGMY